MDDQNKKFLSALKFAYSVLTDKRVATRHGARFLCNENGEPVMHYADMLNALGDLAAFLMRGNQGGEPAEENSDHESDDDSKPLFQENPYSE